MRCLPALALVILTAAPALASAQQAPKRTVYLNDLTMEDLRTTNPKHYAEARKVMADMKASCAMGQWQSQPAFLKPGECSVFLLSTSNPPKRRVTFVVEDTLYIASVTVTEPAAGAQPVGPR
jgi:hypothetical protein